MEREATYVGIDVAKSRVDVPARRGIESLDDRDVFRYEIAEEGTYRLVRQDQPAGVGFWYIWDSDGNLWLRATEDPVDIIQWNHKPGT